MKYEQYGHEFERDLRQENYNLLDTLESLELARKELDYKTPLLSSGDKKRSVQKRNAAAASMLRNVLNKINKHIDTAEDTEAEREKFRDKPSPVLFEEFAKDTLALIQENIHRKNLYTATGHIYNLLQHIKSYKESQEKIIPTIKEERE